MVDRLAINFAITAFPKPAPGSLVSSENLTKLGTRMAVRTRLQTNIKWLADFELDYGSYLRPHFFYFMVYGSADVVFWRNGKKIKFDFYTNFIIFFPPTLPRTSKTTSGQNKRIKLCYLCKKFRCVILFSTRRQTFVGALPIHAITYSMSVDVFQCLHPGYLRSR